MSGTQRLMAPRPVRAAPVRPPTVPAFRPESPVARGPVQQAEAGPKVRYILPPYLREKREEREAVPDPRTGEAQRDGDKEKDEKAKTGKGSAALGPATEGEAPGLESDAKGTRRPKARKGQLQRLAAPQPIRPNIVAIPAPESGSVALGRARLRPPSTDGNFETPTEPRFGPPPRTDGKSEPVSPERVRAITMFQQAMAVARRLHDGLVADAQATVARVEAGVDQLAARRQTELDQGMAGLEEGLRATRAEFDRVADAAVDLVDQGEQQTRVAIQGAASAAFGALNGAKSAADATFKTHGKNKDDAKKSADTAASSVTAAGAGASGAVLALDRTKEVDHKTTIAPAPPTFSEAAVNEAINVRLPTRTPARAKTYTDEASAEFAQLSATFGSMKSAIEEQFKAIAAQMTRTASAGTSSIAKVRDQTLQQLTETAAQLRGSIDETRANGHVSLVRQHDLSRRQALVAWRDRGRSEDQSAQQRATRGANAAMALANAQQAGAKSLADNLDREKARPADDFAKVILSSASALVNHTGKTGADQRTRVMRSAEAGESGAARQADATAARLAGSVREMVERLDEAGQGIGTSLTQQIERSVASFDQLPPPIFDALKGALSSARTAYAGQNQQAEQKVTEAKGVVTGAMSGKGGGSENKGAAKPGAAPAAPASESATAKEIPDQFVARAKAITEKADTDSGIAELLATARKEVPPIIRTKADRVHSALVAFSTPVEAVMAALRAITAIQGAAMSAFYRDHYSRDLESHLRRELWKTFSADSTNRYNISAAINYLRGNHVAAALAEMKAAVNYSNDEGRVERIQRSLTPAELDQLKTQHGEELEEIIDDLGGTDRKVSEALNRIKPVDPRSPDAAKVEQENLKALGEANAYGLKHDIDKSRGKRGEAGGDATADMLAGKRQSIGDDVLSGGDALTPVLEDWDAARERKNKIWKATEQGFDKVVTTLPDGSPNVAKPEDKNPPGAIARYAAAVRSYQEFVPDNSERGGHYRTVSEGLDPRQTQLLDAIVKHGGDSEEAAAATIAVELNRKSGKPKEDRLRKALGSDVLAAREGESDAKRKRRLEGLVDAQGKLLLDAKGQPIDKGDQKRAEERRRNILLKYGELTSADPQQEAVKPAPDGGLDTKANRIRDQIVGRLGDQLAGDPTAKAYTQSMVTNLEPDPMTAFDFALAHEEKNKETLQATAGRLNRDQIDAAVTKWDAKHPWGPPLYKQLGMFEHGKGALEGDARNETEIKFMGVPRNDRERAETANMASKQQVRDSGAAGRAMASEEYRRMLATQATLLGLMGVTAADIDEYGRIKKKGKDGQEIRANFNEDGKLIVKTEGQRDEFEAAMQLSYLDAEGYKDAVDRAAMGITMALMVIAAAITTFVTFGGAAAIWAPILITAGAGLVGIAMTAAIKGDRYTSAEIQRDLVMTFVQAATAGLGAYAGTALRGTGAVAKAAATTEKVAGGIAGVAAKPALSLGAKALNLGKEVVIDSVVGGTTNMINSAAGAAMDPENRRQGKSGQKALEGGVKSFLGGAVGSSLTKPVGALAKPAGKMAERMSGNVAAGFGTRLSEARVGQAMGDPHQSWAESLESAKEGIAQDVIQGAAEHGAERFANRRATVKAQRAARAREEPAAPAVPRTPVEEPPPRTRPAAPAEGPQHTPASLTRAVAVHEALPPPLRAEVDTALLPKPVAPPPIEPIVPRAAAPEADLADARRPLPAATGEDPVTQRRPEQQPAEAEPGTQRRPDVPAGAEARPARKKPPVPHPEIPWAPADFLEGAVMMDPKSHSRAEVEVAYRNTIAADPSREVAIYRNPETGEHIMVFGNADQVFIGANKDVGQAPHAAEPEGMRQDWKKMLPKDVGRWELEAHYHPGFDGKHDVAPMARRVPSTGEGGVGDFQVLRYESQVAGDSPRRSVIDFTHEGRPGHTVFGFDPADPKPYWIDVENPRTGKREEHRFATPRDYENWARQHGASPNRDVPAAPQAKPLPGLPTPHDEEMTMRHGTTKADAEAIRASGIDPHRKSGAADDFGRGFYVTLDEANAQHYATKRSGGAGGEVLSTTMKLSELGVVVDVRDGGAHRAQWDAFLDRQPAAYPPWGAGIFKTAREFVTGTGALRMNEIQRGVVFEAFLAEAGLGHADAIRGDLGKGLTTGIAAHADGEQLAIRSKALADKLNERMGFGPQGAPHEGPVKPGSGQVSTAARAAAARQTAELEDAFAGWTGFDLETVPPGKAPPTPPKPERIRAAEEARTAAQAVDREGVETFRASAPKKAVALLDRLTALDPKNVAAAIHAEFEGGDKAALDKHRERMIKKEGKTPAEAEAAIRKWHPFSEDGALDRFEQKLAETLGPTKAAAERAALKALLREGGLREAVLAARERKAWSNVIDTPFDPNNMLDPGHRALAVKSRRLLAVARMDPESARDRYARMLEKSPRGKPTVAKFEAQWDDFQTAMHLPVVSEADATFRLAKDKNLEILKSDSTGGNNKGSGFVNQGGIDIIGFVRPKTNPLPDKVEVHLIDDKAVNKKRLSNVSAQTENLGQNLRKHADEIAAQLAKDRAAGLPIDPVHEMAVKQLVKAADEIEALDKGRIGRGGARARHRQDRYIDAVAAILKDNGIVMSVTSERGNVKTLARWLERYGFRMAFDDEAASDGGVTPVPP